MRATCWRALGLAAAWATAGAAAAQAPAGSADGKKLYDKWCAQCHGVTGDGKGPAAPHVRPKPRDFTSGKFKVRTTPNGALPTDDDLKNIIKRGMPYTSMPAWPSFTDPELSQLVAHIKTFHDGFADPSRAPKSEDFGPVPAFTQESAEKGKQAYTTLGCARCHGDEGRGDGMSGPTLKDDFSHPIRPADLTQRWTFRGGATREDIFRTLSTGLNGTPMPSFKDALKPEERWALVDFIASLSDSEQQSYGTLVVASAVDEELDLAKGRALFERAAPVRFPIVGQIMEPGRAFFPSATSVVVRAVYDQKRIAFLVSWNDGTSDTTGKNGFDLVVPPAEEEDEMPAAAAAAPSDDPFFDPATVAPAAAPAASDDPWADTTTTAAAVPASEFSDAVALQLPVQMPTGAVKPYFLLGDGANAVDLWFLDLGSRRPRQFVGRGSSSITPQEGTEVEAQATFTKGEWSVIFVRDLHSTSGLSFVPEQFVPLAFSVWDGMARERGTRRGLTQWAYAYLAPRDKPSAVRPMAAAAGLVLVLEGLVVFALRRRRRAGTGTAA